MKQNPVSLGRNYSRIFTVRKKIFYVSILFLCVCNINFAQDNENFKNHRIAVDVGYVYLGSLPVKQEFIRGDFSESVGGGALKSMHSHFNQTFFGVQYEYLLPNNILSVNAGLRYTFASEGIGNLGYSSNENNFFYVRTSQSGTTTEYLKVRNIYSNSQYIGIPIEGKVYLPEITSFLRIYFKTGGYINYLLNNEKDVDFLDPDMKPNAPEVARLFEKPEPFFGGLYLGGGIRIGQQSKTAVILEGTPVHALVDPTVFSMIETRFGVSCNFKIQIPIQ